MSGRAGLYCPVYRAYWNRPRCKSHKGGQLEVPYPIVAVSTMGPQSFLSFLAPSKHVTATLEVSRHCCQPLIFFLHRQIDWDDGFVSCECWTLTTRHQRPRRRWNHSHSEHDANSTTLQSLATVGTATSSCHSGKLTNIC